MRLLTALFLIVTLHAHSVEAATRRKHVRAPAELHFVKLDRMIKQYSEQANNARRLVAFAKD